VIARKNRVYLWMSGAIALNCMLMIALNLNRGTAVLEELSLAFMFGSLFGHTTVAAAWAALGPGRLIGRVPLSLAWTTLLTAAYGVNLNIHGGPDETLLIGAVLLVQWALLQLPLWTLAISQGLHLRHVDTVNQSGDMRKNQFGLRQLIIVTAGVGVLLGIGRIVVPHYVEELAQLADDLVILIVFLGIAEAVLTMPLLLAALLQRRAVFAVLLALVLIGAATVLECQVLIMVGGKSPPLGNRLFVAINSGTAVMLLLLLTIVRLNGYSLTISRVQQPTVTG